MKSIRFISAMTVLVLILAVSGAAFAAWPEKPVNVIVPWSPGGASDLTARTLAAEMEKLLGTRLFTNTPGGRLSTQPC